MVRAQNICVTLKRSIIFCNLHVAVFIPKFEAERLFRLAERTANIACGRVAKTDLLFFRNSNHKTTKEKNIYGKPVRPR